VPRGLKPRSVGMIQVIAAYLLLSIGILSNKYVVRFMDPALFVALRMLTSSAILVLYNRRQVDKIDLRSLAYHVYGVLFVSLCTTFLPAYLKAWSLKQMLVTKQTLLGSVDPLVTAIIAYYMLNERLTWLKLIGIVLGMCGVGCIVLWDAGEECWQSLARIDLPEIAVLTAIVLSRYGWTRVQRLLHAGHYTPVQLNMLVQLCSGFLALLFWGLVPYLNLSSNNCPVESCPHYGYLGAALLLTIVGGNVLGYTLYTRCLKHYPATLMSVAGLSIPLLVTIGAYVVYGERLSGGMILGATAIALGIVIFNYQAVMSILRRRYVS
jgi:drug/metabolite transporter (DMT)-like permease